MPAPRGRLKSESFHAAFGELVEAQGQDVEGALRG